MKTYKFETRFDGKLYTFFFFTAAIFFTFLGLVGKSFSVAFMMFLIMLTGNVVFTEAFIFFKKRRRIKDIPTSTIDSAVVGGTVEVHGELLDIPSFDLTSPLSGKSCAFYFWTIYKQVKTNNGVKWREIGMIYSHEYLIVNDGGKYNASIPVASAKFQGKGMEKFSKRFNERDRKFPNDIKMIITESRIIDFSKKRGEYLIVENIITKHQPLFIIGETYETKKERKVIVNDKISKEHLRQRFKSMFKNITSNKTKLRKFDLDGDGKISQEELLNLKKYIHREVQTNQGQKYYEQELEKCSIHFDRVEKNKGVFDFSSVLVSTENQETTLKRLLFYGILSFVIGVALLTSSILYVIDVLFINIINFS